MMRENKIFFANKMEERHFDLLEEDFYEYTHVHHFSLLTTTTLYAPFYYHSFSFPNTIPTTTATPTRTSPLIFSLLSVSLLLPYT